MDAFLKFNRKNVDDRQVDTLIGISKGLLADGKLVQREAEFLYTWLIQSRQATSNPIIVNLLSRVEMMMSDGVLDDEETAELWSILESINGETSELGELAKTTSLPLATPATPIEFQDRNFLFTGTCAFGTRRECHNATKKLGGKPVNSVTKSLDYLVLGSYVTDSWMHETFGRKIEKAMKYRDEGASIIIISENHWATNGGLI